MMTYYKFWTVLTTQFGYVQEKILLCVKTTFSQVTLDYVREFTYHHNLKDKFIQTFLRMSYTNPCTIESVHIEVHGSICNARHHEKSD